jgi:hypothetical protein
MAVASVIPGTGTAVRLPSYQQATLPSDRSAHAPELPTAIAVVVTAARAVVGTAARVGPSDSTVGDVELAEMVGVGTAASVVTGCAAGPAWQAPRTEITAKNATRLRTGSLNVLRCE